MKLLMAVSADGYVARDDTDDMKWTGEADKAAFRLLTHVYLGPLAVGRRTAELMPGLAGRELYVLSRHPSLGHGTLDDYQSLWSGWLLGGQTVALEALRSGYLTQLFLCYNRVNLGDGVKLDESFLTESVSEGVVKIAGDVIVDIRRVRT